jgi:actin related protein 2/3 complex subunit 5
VFERGADLRAQEAHLAAVMEVLQSIRQADMSPMLGRLYKGEGGAEALDTLMKYMYVISARLCRLYALLMTRLTELTCGQIQGHGAVVASGFQARVAAEHRVLADAGAAVGGR